MTEFKQSVAEAVRVAWARALADGKAPVYFEPKALCDEIRPEVECLQSATPAEKVVLHFNSSGREVRIVPSKMTVPPVDLPAYLAGILCNECLAVVERTALRAVEQALEGVVVGTRLGQMTVRGQTARLAGFEFQLKLKLEEK